MKVGFIGAGGIARKMAVTMKGLENCEQLKRALLQMYPDFSGEQLPTVECTAVAARERKRAEAFAKEYGFRRAYGSYEELLTDSEVELVYIAIPHSHHCQWTKAALLAGKNVLCEKAFALNEQEAREMLELAKEKKLLLAEAIWTRYMPSRKMIDEIIKSGEIGEVRTLSANLGYPVFMNERLINPALGGGALLDLTVYPLNFASMILGDDMEKLDAFCIMDSHGVDGQDQVVLTYKGGQMATLFTTMYTMTDRAGWVYGEKGALEVQNINNPEKLRVYRNTEHHTLELVRECAVPKQINGYEYEVISCALALINEEKEYREMPHVQTLEMMRQMDRIREIWKI